MKLTTTAFAEMGAIPPAFAFATVDPAAHIRLSENLSPDFEWRDAPAGAKSFVLICHDPDVPSRPDDVNKEGRVVPASLPRVEFCHWVLVDIAPTTSRIARGEYCRGVAAKGKPGPAAANGTRQGINDYTGWFAGDKDMAGDYYGYDGPCPPWNDEIPHRYVFTLFALDVERLAVEGKFTMADARRAMEGHVLAQASVTGRYTLNPAVQL